MATDPGQRRINITLSAEHAEKLAMLANQSNLQEGTLARALLSTAIDEAPAGSATVSNLLLRIPGAMDRIRAGIDAADRGDVIPIDEL